MTLSELIEQLEYIRDNYDGGIDGYGIKGALQPNYPMVGSLMNVCVDHEDKRVYLAMSDNEAYGCPVDAWDNEEIGDFEDEEDDSEEEEDSED